MTRDPFMSLYHFIYK